MAARSARARADARFSQVASAPEVGTQGPGYLLHVVEPDLVRRGVRAAPR